MITSRGWVGWEMVGAFGIHDKLLSISWMSAWDSSAVPSVLVFDPR